MVVVASIDIADRIFALKTQAKMENIRCTDIDTAPAICAIGSVDNRTDVFVGTF